MHLRLLLGGQIGPKELGPPLCVVFEGWDASGKGGAIQRLVSELDPRHVRVAQFAAPTHDEKRHHFLWRFWPKLPGWGGMAVLDRSWYGRVLVERVEGFATEEAVAAGLRARSSTSRRTLAAEGMILVKFWMHVSPEEQLRRFEKRRDDPYKTWKLTDEDWRNREKRDAVRGSRRGHAGPHRPPGRRRGTSSPRTTSAGPASTSSARCARAMEQALIDRGIDPDPPLS